MAAAWSSSAGRIHIHIGTLTPTGLHILCIPRRCTQRPFTHIPTALTTRHIRTTMGRHMAAPSSSAADTASATPVPCTHTALVMATGTTAVATGTVTTDQLPLIATPQATDDLAA